MKDIEATDLDSELVHIILGNDSCPNIEHTDTYCGIHGRQLSENTSSDVNCKECISSALEKFGLRENVKNKSKSRNKERVS